MNQSNPKKTLKEIITAIIICIVCGLGCTFTVIQRIIPNTKRISDIKLEFNNKLKKNIDKMFVTDLPKDLSREDHTKYTNMYNEYKSTYLIPWWILAIILAVVTLLSLGYALK